MRKENMRRAREYIYKAIYEVEKTFYDKVSKEKLLKKMISLAEDISHDISLLDP